MAVAAAEVAVEQARAKLAHADADVESAMTGPQQVTITQSQVSVAQAKVAQQQADLDQALLNLQYTTIVAPVERRSSARRTSTSGKTSPRASR